MKRFLPFLLLFTVFTYAQHTISGVVTDPKGRPLPGANVFLDGTYDGTSSAEDGTFSFTTNETGTKLLRVTFLTYEPFSIEVNVAAATKLTIKLKESINALDAVVITAGTMEAGEKARVSVLKPLDIVTTAGSAGNIVAALQTLPGTQTVGESGRLFVRGGEADETQTFVDGVRVAQPYGASANNIPTRGRFSPFLFSGISFSTGGYSAEYGEALSSVLLLNTIDEPDQEKTDVSLMTVGLGVGNTQKWKKDSFSLNTAYINLAPYQVAIPQAVDWNRPYESLSGEAVYRHQFNDGILKVYGAFDAARFDLNQVDINQPEKVRFALANNNFYFNSVYKGIMWDNWSIHAGLGLGYSRNGIGINLDDVANVEQAGQLKLKLQKKFSDRLKLTIGGDYFRTKFDESFIGNNGDTFRSGYDSGIAAGYAELDVFLSKKFAFKAGFRATDNHYLDEKDLSPRASLAYKVSKYGQFSLAYGRFSQAPRQDYLKYSDAFETEKAAHYILNFQYARDGRTFRTEAYYKDYNDLVSYDTPTSQSNSVFHNDGFGYAKGLDVFWRDSKLIKNLEYWVSYSFLDTQRDYQNYPVETMPGFATKHNFSLVTKFFVTEWRSQIGITQSFTSGRPYTNPNESGFLEARTRPYYNTSLGWAYLLSQQKILYFSISNLFNVANVFGYQYANTADANGRFPRRAIEPTADRFFFVGFFWSISEDKKSNQLDNL